MKLKFGKFAPSSGIQKTRDAIGKINGLTVDKTHRPYFFLYLGYWWTDERESTEDTTPFFNCPASRRQWKVVTRATIGFSHCLFSPDGNRVQLCSFTPGGSGSSIIQWTSSGSLSVSESSQLARRLKCDVAASVLCTYQKDTYVRTIRGYVRKSAFVTCFLLPIYIPIVTSPFAT